MSDARNAADNRAAKIKQLAILEWDAGEYAIGYPGENPVFYFGADELELAGKVVAAYNESAANHVCRVIVWEPESDTWVCTECGEHHLVR